MITPDSTPEARGDLTARFSRSTRRRGFTPFNRESLDTFCERGVLGTVLAMLVWGPLATGSTQLSQFLVLLGLGLLMCAFWVVRVWIRQQYRVLFPPFAWTVLVFIGYAIWRYSWVDYEYGARLEILQIILYGLLFFAVLDNLTSSEHIQIILFTLLGLGVLNAFYGIFQYFTDSRHVLWFPKPTVYRGRGSGTFICPNHLAGFLEMLLPIALAYTVTARYKHLTKVFLGYAALAIAAGIGVTLSRGGYLAVAASLVVFFSLLLWNRNFRLPAIGLMTLLIVTSTFFGVRSWQAEKRFADAKHYNMRLLYWKPAVQMWKENFWFGVGPQHYDWRLRKWRHWQLQGRPIYVHNDYLNTVAEYGTTGGIIVGAALLTLAWSVLRTWKYVRRSNEISTRTSNRSAVVLGCSIGLLAIVLHSITDFNLHIPGNAVVAVTLMAIVISHMRFATERFWLNPGIIGRLLVTAVILGAAGYFVWQMSRLVPQTYLLAKFSKTPSWKERLEILKKAHAIEPGNSEVVMEIGIQLRKKAFDGNEGWENVTREAIPWFEKGGALNKWNPFVFTNLGASYDWLGDREKAAHYFEKAREMDPNGHYVLFWYAWHKLQTGELAEARKLFLDSYNFNHLDNEDAKNYVQIVDRMLAERAQTQ
jgi:O-antigen ligase